MKKKGVLTGIIVIFVMACIVLGVFLYIEKELYHKYSMVYVVSAKTDIPDETLVTSDNVNQYYELTKILKENYTQYMLTDLNKIVGKINKQPVTKDEKIYVNNYTEKKEELSKYKEPLEVSFKTKDVVDGNAGRIRKGDIVNIYVKYIDTSGIESFKLLYENKEINNTYDKDYILISTDDKETQSSVYSIYIDSSDQNEFLSAVQNDIYIFKVQ